ncbi:MAG: VOC family protein [Anaerolineales bacterium]|jgi:predicted enzyme related to lactoylglutathione lyase
MNKFNAVTDTIIITSTDIESLASFYQRAFDLPEPNRQGDDHIGFPLGDIYFGFDRVEQPHQEYPGPVSLWFRVDDLSAAFDHCVEIGAKVKYPPSKKPWGDTLAALYDPDGNLIGLAQR